jgi:cell wall-associated NlpC family hydrolase
MYHSRLVGGLTAVAVLLILIVAAPAALAADLPPQNPRAVGIATKCLGVPYMGGGTSLSGLDAPGFTRWVFRRLGVGLPDDLARQMRRGVEVSRDRLKPGDVVYFPDDSGRVGIYVGDGRMIGTSGEGSIVSKSKIPWTGVSTTLRRFDARTGLRVVMLARRHLGVPYLFGGASPKGFDASGLTMYVYAQLGIALDHGATNQQKASRPVALSDLRAGDLVFFGSASYSPHVGIYIGKGMMIDAPHTGAVVSRSPITGAWIGGRLLPVR